jgi:hypothetical protein
MTELPEWILKEYLLCDCTDCDYARLMHDALSMAWKALEHYKKNCSNHSGLAENAMRKIEELGK